MFARASAQLGVAFEVNAAGAVHRQVPDLSDPDEFVAAVRDQFNDLQSRLGQQEHSLTLERREREAAAARFEGELDRRTRELEERASNAAVEGLRLQMLGWLLVFAGLVCGTILNVISAALAD